MLNIDYKKPVRVEQSLVDWRLYYTPSGRKQETHLSCVSEWEARYLKVCLEHGLNRVEVPIDEKVLKEVTVDLEALAQKISKLAEEKLIGYRESTQREVLHNVWQFDEASLQEVKG